MTSPRKLRAYESRNVRAAAIECIRAYDKALAVIEKYHPLERFPRKMLYALAELLPKNA